MESVLSSRFSILSNTRRSTPVNSTTRPGGMREAIKSAARLGEAEPGVPDRKPKAEAKAKSSNLKAIICIRYLQSSKSESLAPPHNPPVPPPPRRNTGQETQVYKRQFTKERKGKAMRKGKENKRQFANERK